MGVEVLRYLIVLGGFKLKLKHASMIKGKKKKPIKVLKNIGIKNKQLLY